MRDDFEVVAANLSLGRAADEALIAIVRLREGRELENRHEVALRYLSELLTAVSEVETNAVLDVSAVQWMVAAGAIDQARNAITSVRVDGETAGIARSIASALDKIVSRSADDGDYDVASDFLERLSSLTLTQSHDLARPPVARSGAG